MDIGIGIYLFLHGFAHLVGFFVPWKIVRDKEHPYKTTILGGIVDLGDGGIRVIGIIWLSLGVVYFIGAFGVISDQVWWYGLIMLITWISLVFTVLGWPDSKFGIIANILLLIFLWVAPRSGWI